MRSPLEGVGARPEGFLSLWAALSIVLTAPLLQAQEEAYEASSMQAYKQKVLALMAKETEPATRRELQRLYQLLSLMERSMAHQEADLPPDDAPVAADKPADEAFPEVPDPAISAPSTAPKEENDSSKGLFVERDLEDASAESDKEAGGFAIPEASEVGPTTAKPPAWYVRTGLTAAFGYQENLLKSAFSDLESSALLGQIDLELFKIRRDEHRFFAFGRYNRTHFLDEPEVRDEDLLFLLAQYERRLSDTWWAGLRGDYLRAHQPIDDFEGIDRLGLSLPLSIEQFSLGPLVSREWNEVHTWSAGVGYRREEVGRIVDFEDQSSDQFWLESDYTFEPTERQRWRAGYLFTYRDYDERAQRLPDGSVLIGSHAEVLSHRLFLEHRRTWHWGEGRWRWTNGVRFVHEDGNGPGYDDVDRVEFRSRVDVRYSRWELLAEIRRGHDRYDARQVSLLDRSEVRREYWIGRIEGSCRVADDWRFWLRYEGADRSGNREIDRYRYQSVYAGFQRSF